MLVAQWQIQNKINKNLLSREIAERAGGEKNKLKERGILQTINIERKRVREEDSEESRKANKKSLEQETMRLGKSIPVNKKSLMSSSSMEDRMKKKTAASYVSKVTEQKS